MCEEQVKKYLTLQGIWNTSTRFNLHEIQFTGSSSQTQHVNSQNQTRLSWISSGLQQTSRRTSTSLHPKHLIPLPWMETVQEIDVTWSSATGLIPPCPRLFLVGITAWRGRLQLLLHVHCDLTGVFHNTILSGWGHLPWGEWPPYSGANWLSDCVLNWPVNKLADIADKQQQKKANIYKEQNSNTNNHNTIGQLSLFFL